MKLTHYLVTTFLVLGCSGALQAQYISTVAGNGTMGYAGNGAPAISAEVNTPSGVAIDKSGNMYIADAGNNVVRKVNSAGTISTFAGSNVVGYSGDGFAATLAKLNTPVAVTVDAFGNVFISENKNNCIRKVDTATGIITTVAGMGGGPGGFTGDSGPAIAAQLWGPMGIAFDLSGNLYIADDSNNRVRIVVTGSGLIFTYAGSGVPGWVGAGYGGDTGPAASAKLNCPSAVAFDSASINLYISDAGNARIRAVNLSTSKITTYAGNGTSGFAGDGLSAGSAEIHNPGGIAINLAGDLYFADVTNNRIRMISGTSYVISTISGAGATLGDGGPATAAQMLLPSDVKLDATGNLFVADAGHNRVREITAGPSIKILGDTAVCLGKTSTLTDATTGGTWTSGTSSVATIGSSSGIVTGVAVGTATITYNSGTNAAYQVVAVTKCKTAVNAVSAAEYGLKVYPNPTEGTFTLLLSSDNAEQATVTISNLVGTKVKEFKTTTNTSLDVQLDAPSGIYFLNAATPSGRWTEKITVIR